MSRRRARTLRLFKRYAPTTIGFARGGTAALLGAVEPLGSALKYFRPEFEAGIAKQAAAVPA